jgi:hypothetical protein
MCVDLSQLFAFAYVELGGRLYSGTGVDVVCSNSKATQEIMLCGP